MSPRREIVDTHLHVWSDDAQSYPFAEGRQHTPGASVEVLVERMAQSGVQRAVIVQPVHYLYDNRYVADCLRRFPGRFAAVGLVDRHAPDAADRLQGLVDQGFCGLRLHLSRPDDPAEWAAPDQDPIWERARQLGTCFQVFGPAALLPAIEPIVARHPDVPVVLDHNGGAPIGDDPHGLFDIVAGFARYPQVTVKLTPQAHRSQEDFPHRDTWPLYASLRDAFGGERLMWGTNFPGVLKGLGYARALELFRTMDVFTDAERRQLFETTPARVWRFAGA